MMFRGFFVEHLHEKRMDQVAGNVMESLKVILGTDDGDEPMQIRLTITDEGCLELQESSGRQLLIKSRGANVIEVYSQRRFPVKSKT